MLKDNAIRSLALNFMLWIHPATLRFLASITKSEADFEI